MDSPGARGEDRRRPVRGRAIRQWRLRKHFGAVLQVCGRSTAGGTLCSLMSEAPELRVLLENPAVPRASKRGVIEALAGRLGVGQVDAEFTTTVVLDRRICASMPFLEGENRGGVHGAQSSRPAARTSPAPTMTSPAVACADDLGTEAPVHGVLEARSPPARNRAGNHPSRSGSDRRGGGASAPARQFTTSSVRAQHRNHHAACCAIGLCDREQAISHPSKLMRQRRFFASRLPATINRTGRRRSRAR